MTGGSRRFKMARQGSQNLIKRCVCDRKRRDAWESHIHRVNCGPPLPQSAGLPHILGLAAATIHDSRPAACPCGPRPWRRLATRARLRASRPRRSPNRLSRRHDSRFAPATAPEAASRDPRPWQRPSARARGGDLRRPLCGPRPAAWPAPRRAPNRLSRRRAGAEGRGLFRAAHRHRSGDFAVQRQVHGRWECHRTGNSL